MWRGAEQAWDNALSTLTYELVVMIYLLASGVSTPRTIGLGHRRETAATEGEIILVKIYAERAGVPVKNGTGESNIEVDTVVLLTTSIRWT
jgi:hypothetical protein